MSENFSPDTSENYKNLTTRQNPNLDLNRMLRSYLFENRRLTDIVGRYVLIRKMAEAILSRCCLICFRCTIVFLMIINSLHFKSKLLKNLLVFAKNRTIHISKQNYSSLCLMRIRANNIWSTLLMKDNQQS